MTLDNVQVCLDGVFTHGHAYVALSRVTSLDGLTLKNDFDPKTFSAHPAVVNFNHSLKDLNVPR